MGLAIARLLFGNSKKLVKPLTSEVGGDTNHSESSDKLELCMDPLSCFEGDKVGEVLKPL